MSHQDFISFNSLSVTKAECMIMSKLIGEQFPKYHINICCDCCTLLYHFKCIYQEMLTALWYGVHIKGCQHFLYYFHIMDCSDLPTFGMNMTLNFLGFNITPSATFTYIKKKYNFYKILKKWKTWRQNWNITSSIYLLYMIL